MLSAVLADALVIVHLAFIVFVVLGGLLAIKWPRAAWLHLPAAAWGAYVEFTGKVCPLTPLEQALRASSGDGGYSGGFIDHYIVPLIYPADMTPATGLVLGLFVLVVNAIVYGLVLRRRRRRVRWPGDSAMR